MLAALLYLIDTWVPFQVSQQSQTADGKVQLGAYQCLPHLPIHVVHQCTQHSLVTQHAHDLLCTCDVVINSCTQVAAQQSFAGAWSACMQQTAFSCSAQPNSKTPRTHYNRCMQVACTFVRTATCTCVPHAFEVPPPEQAKPRTPVSGSPPWHLKIKSRHHPRLS